MVYNLSRHTLNIGGLGVERYVDINTQPVIEGFPFVPERDLGERCLSLLPYDDEADCEDQPELSLEYDSSPPLPVLERAA